MDSDELKEQMREDRRSMNVIVWVFIALALMVIACLVGLVIIAGGG